MDCSQAEQTWFEVKAFLTNAGIIILNDLNLIVCEKFKCDQI